MSDDISRKREFKDRVFSELERVGKALGSRRRLELLDVLSQGPHSVESLAGELNVSVASASQHLQKLRQANLVSRRREGSHVFYEVANRDVADFYAGFTRLAERMLPGLEATVGSYFESPMVPEDEIPEVLEEVRRGDAVLIDTRPRHEYDAGHVADAKSVPITEISNLSAELPTDKRIVAYCRGPYCTFADTAVRALRGKGFEAVRVDLGISDFRRIGAAIAA